MPATPRIPRDTTGLAALVSLLAGLHAPARLFESAVLLRQIQAGVGADQPSGIQTRVTFRPRDQSRSGDLYTMGEPKAGMVLVPGAAQLGKDDPRLVAFARALAKARFEVLVPDLPGLAELWVGSGDAEIIADALLALSRHRAAQGSSATVGVTAICYSTGPAMVALLDGAVRGRAQFMLSIGGYLSIEAVISFITTGCYVNPYDGARLYRVPDEYGKWVFAISTAKALASDKDRELLEAMARRRLADRTADLSDLSAGLGKEGRAVHAVLQNSDPERVKTLVESLPRHIAAEIGRLDLARRDLFELDMRFILIHGRDDAVIPETESIALAGALPQAQLFLLNSMQHVDPGPAGLGDKLKLLAAVYGVLRERDTVRPPKAPVGVSPLKISSDPEGAG